MKVFRKIKKDGLLDISSSRKKIQNNTQLQELLKEVVSVGFSGLQNKDEYILYEEKMKCILEYMNNNNMHLDRILSTLGNLFQTKASIYQNININNLRNAFDEINLYHSVSIYCFMQALLAVHTDYYIDEKKKQVSASLSNYATFLNDVYGGIKK